MSLNKKLIAFALFTCTFMSAIEITIVTTAMPSIVKDLNGFNLASYVFSIYLLTSAVATTVFGKLSDVYGRKKLLQLSILTFITGSALCGLSHSMIFLIIARAVQGIGSGAINTLTMASIGDLFDIEERTKMQGYNSTIWSLASLCAPVLGGAILIKLTWHWIFFINVPIGLMSIFFIHKAYNKKEIKRNQKVDTKGLTYLTFFIIFIIQAMSGLEKNPIYSPKILGLILGSLISVVLFIKAEKKSDTPILPYKLFSKEIFIVMSIAFFNSMVLIAMDVYNPSFMQNIQGFAPMMSAVAIVPMSLCWVLASFILANIISRYSSRNILVFSLGFIALGTLMLVFYKPESNPVFMAAASSIIGLGFGGAFNMLLFIVQETLSKEDMGIASGSVMFIRTLGQTLGISMFGFISNKSIAAFFSRIGVKVNIESILSNTGINHQDVIKSLFSGYNNIYITCCLICILCVILAFFLNSKKKLGDMGN